MHKNFPGVTVYILVFIIWYPFWDYGGLIFFFKDMHDLTIFFNYIFQNTFPFIIMQHYTINEEYNLDNQILKTMKYFK